MMRVCVFVYWSMLTQSLNWLVGKLVSKSVSSVCRVNYLVDVTARVARSESTSCYLQIASPLMTFGRKEGGSEGRKNWMERRGEGSRKEVRNE